MISYSLQYSDFREIFKSHLHIEQKVKSIESLFENPRLEKKLNFSPYYQRKYVWDKQKATYFIESILLGTEIPPLVLFNNGSSIEVIDGRQRYETIKKFINNEFKLVVAGLDIFKNLKDKDFNSLDKELKNIFWDTKLRILEFSVINEPKLDEIKEDLIKKEIFRRYNSGITPLRKADLGKAIYINDNLNSLFKTKLKEEHSTYDNIIKLMGNDKDYENKSKGYVLEKTLQQVRKLNVINHIPIKKYSNSEGKSAITKLYDIIAEEIEDYDAFYDKFKNKINIVCKLKSILEKNNTQCDHNCVYECVFWAITVLEESNKINSIDEVLLHELSLFIVNNHSTFSNKSLFYRDVLERFKMMASFFEQKYDVSFSIYLDDYSIYNEKKQKLNAKLNEHNIISDDFRIRRLNKPEPSSVTIEDICKQMNRENFFVRPIYQRDEVSNKKKCSKLIESILLGIKLPPIFICKRENGVSEVIDGQQRLLSIIGFIGKSFLDENGNKVKSEKNNFKLSDLEILCELNGKKFEELAEIFQDKILDFNLAIVEIDRKLNPEFDPVDLFIRLNNKPFPIRENSFEMWNSYVDKELIMSIKANVEKHSGWFYVIHKDRDTRMLNEELYTTLSYFEYKKLSNENIDNFLKVYQREQKISVRLKDKSNITKVLESTIDGDSEKTEKNRFRFNDSIKRVESFISKLRIILIDSDIDDENNYLKTELDSLLIRKAKRTNENFYTLWIFLNDINKEMVKQHRATIKTEILNLVRFMQDVKLDANGIASFEENLSKFKKKYSIEKRYLKISKDEKKDIIKRQGNICPFCNNPLYSADEIEADHIIPLALGGKDELNNIQLLHLDCNRKKGAKLV